MHQVVLSPQASQDLFDILEWTARKFGPRARSRYRTLLNTAIRDIGKDPGRLGSTSTPELHPFIRTYHISFSRRRSARAGASVASPRHFLVYRIADAGIIDLVRVLHDSTDLELHFT